MVEIAVAVAMFSSLDSAIQLVECFFVVASAEVVATSELGLFAADFEAAAAFAGFAVLPFVEADPSVVASAIVAASEAVD